MYEVWFEIAGVNWSEFMYNFEETGLLKPNLCIITSFLQLHFVECQYLKSLETPRIFIARIKYEQANSLNITLSYSLQNILSKNTKYILWYYNLKLIFILFNYNWSLKSSCLIKITITVTKIDYKLYFSEPKSTTLIFILAFYLIFKFNCLIETIQSRCTCVSIYINQTISQSIEPNLCLYIFHWK